MRFSETETTSPYDFRLVPAAFLIREAARFASAAFAKPMTAEYLLPVAWATKKLRSTPASATVCVILCARPGLLSPSTRIVGIVASVSPTPVRRVRSRIKKDASMTEVISAVAIRDTKHVATPQYRYCERTAQKDQSWSR